MIILIDRIFQRLLAIYRKKLFLSKIKNHQNSVKILGKIYINASNIIIGRNLTIYPGVYFWGDGEIKIGNNVDIGVGTIIYSKKRVYIGDNTIIAGQCYIIDSNHNIMRNQIIRNNPLIYDEEGIFIGNNVWISAGCKIIKGAHVGNGAVIGALSLVNCKIKENSIAFGIPAKSIKERT